jgi:hypothetical protein
VLAHQILHHLSHGRLPHTERGCGVHHIGLSLTTQEEDHAGLERRHADQIQTSSELAVQLQHQFQEGQFLMAVVLDTVHG